MSIYLSQSENLSWCLYTARHHLFAQEIIHIISLSTHLPCLPIPHPPAGSFRISCVHKYRPWPWHPSRAVKDWQSHRFAMIEALLIASIEPTIAQISSFVSSCTVWYTFDPYVYLFNTLLAGQIGRRERSRVRADVLRNKVKCTTDAKPVFYRWVKIVFRKRAWDRGVHDLKACF